MLAGVLLHMIEAASPIDAALHFKMNERITHNMRNAIPLVNHFDDVRSTQLPGIERLAAGCGIKRGAIEIDALPVRTRGIRTHFNHASPEFGEIAVLIIQAVCHCTASCTEVLSTLSTSSSVIVLLP